MDIYIHKTADIDSSAKIGKQTKIWNNAQIRENAKIGNNCNIGKDAYIDHDVTIGNNCRIQNQALIYYGTTIEDNVFIGPQVCFANDKFPRAVTDEGKPKTKEDWNVGFSKVEEGASIGAGSIILPGIKIGRWAIIGAGSVVTKDIPAHGLFFGNPAKFKGYVCICGGKLSQKSGKLHICLVCGREVKIL